jgi:hypothetical protein
MTTLIGKILVLLNVSVALLMAAWAWGVYTRHIEFSADTNKSAQETVVQVNALADQLGTQAKPGQWAHLQAAEAYWANPAGAGTPLDAYSRVQLLEKLRPENEKWFQAHLDNLANSNQNQVRRPSYVNGQLEMDPRQYGRPKLVDAFDRGNQPLKSLSAYRAQYNDLHLSIVSAMDELKKWIKADIDLTQQIGAKGGLRDQLAREVDKREAVIKEQDYVKSLLVNSAVEGELLAQRRADLEARVKELKAAGVASSR